MRILIACEFSGTVRDAFIKRGHDAWSCDLLPNGGKHIQDDVLPLLDQAWDLIVAFPPCTHLATSGARWFPEKRADGRQQEGIDFFMEIANADCPRIAIENPVGIMSTVWRKPDQIIQPWQFGDEATKTTCLWLKGLRKLTPSNIVGKGERVTFQSGKSMPKWYANAWKLPPAERAKLRSITFQGIADAMAEQWGNRTQERTNNDLPNT